MNGSKRPDNPDPLDDLLNAARWPAMLPDATLRLRREWQAISRNRSSSQTKWLQAAAMILIGFGVWFVVIKQRSAGVAQQRIVSMPPNPIIQNKPDIVAVRLANPAELAWALTAMSRQEIAGQSHGKSASVQKSPETLQALLQRDPTTGVQECLKLAELKHEEPAVSALKNVRGVAIEKLFARLDDPRIETRLAAARLLGKVDGPRVTEQLARMVAANQNRREALAALLQSDGVEAKAFLEQVQEKHGLESVLRSVTVQIKAF